MTASNADSVTCTFAATTKAEALAAAEKQNVGWQAVGAVRLAEIPAFPGRFNYRITIKKRVGSGAQS